MHASSVTCSVSGSSESAPRMATRPAIVEGSVSRMTLRNGN
jgi:hypothetical protein